MDMARDMNLKGLWYVAKSSDYEPLFFEVVQKGKSKGLFHVILFFFFFTHLFFWLSLLIIQTQRNNSYGVYIPIGEAGWFKIFRFIYYLFGNTYLVIWKKHFCFYIFKNFSQMLVMPVNYLISSIPYRVFPC